MYDIKHRITGETLLSVPAKLRKPRFYGPNLSRAKFPKGVNLENADLRGADLRGVNLEGANLRGADLRCADLSQTRLKHADLEGACLFCATLRGAGLFGVNLKWADLRGADLSFTNILGYLEGADLSGANLSFTSVNTNDDDTPVPVGVPLTMPESAKRATAYGVSAQAYFGAAFATDRVDPFFYFMHHVQNFEDLRIPSFALAQIHTDGKEISIGDVPESLEPLAHSPSDRREASEPRTEAQSLANRAARLAVYELAKIDRTPSEWLEWVKRLIHINDDVSFKSPEESLFKTFDDMRQLHIKHGRPVPPILQLCPKNRFELDGWLAHQKQFVL